MRYMSIISTRQAKYDCAQLRLLDLFRRLCGGEPLHNAFPFFWPLFVLAPYFKGKDAHLTDDSATVPESLFIRECTNRAPGNRAHHPGLLKGFTRSRMMGRLALFWPTLRNDPTSGFARSDQHELRSGTGAEPVGQGAVLNAPRSAYFTPATHRRCTLLNAYSRFFNTQAIPPGKVPLCRRVRKEICKARKSWLRTMPPRAASRSKPRRRRWPRSNARQRSCGRHLRRQWRP